MESNHRSLRLGLVAFVTLVMMTQFNNCSGYQQADNSSSTDTAVLCTTKDCITPVLENLEIIPNLGGSTQYDVTAQLGEWNLGGDCNEGGYPSNVITWELWLNGLRVRDSGMSGMAATNVNSRCVNGRFLLYVSLAAIAADNVNRTGLNSPQGRTQYDLYVEIYGVDAAGITQRNPLKARRHITLIPIL